MIRAWRWRSRRSDAAAAYARAEAPSEHTPWRAARFVVVDLEMTGLDPGRDEIISFAAIPIDEGRVAVGEMRAAIIRPERMPTEETILIHGLRPADLVGAPPLSEVLDVILEALTGRVLVAHPAWVEKAFLRPALAQAGVKLAEPVLDTAQLAAHVLAGSETVPTGHIPLAEAAEGLGLPIHSPHQAQGDALTTAQLFLACATRLERREPQTVGTLAAYSAA